MPHSPLNHLWWRDTGLLGGCDLFDLLVDDRTAAALQALGVESEDKCNDQTSYLVNMATANVQVSTSKSVQSVPFTMFTKP